MSEIVKELSTGRVIRTTNDVFPYTLLDHEYTAVTGVTSRKVLGRIHTAANGEWVYLSFASGDIFTILELAEIAEFMSELG